MIRPPLLVALCGGVLLVAAALFGRDARRLVLSAWSEFAQFRPRRGAVPLPPDAAAAGFAPVAFDVAEVGTMRGWYAPARTGAAVVVAHGSGGDRRAVLDVALALARGGHGVLLFDWPGHGESEGAMRVGAPERRALRAAVDYLCARPDVAGGRVGAYGFSMGALIVAQVAADDGRVRAVALAAPPSDVRAYTLREYAPQGRAAQWGALLGVRLGGLRLDDPQPIALVPRIAPRPLLIVTGEADAAATPATARALYAAAGEPKRLWVVAGAGHGGYGEAARDYGERIRAFFDEALGDDALIERGGR